MAMGTCNRAWGCGPDRPGLGSGSWTIPRVGSAHQHILPSCCGTILVSSHRQQTRLVDSRVESAEKVRRELCTYCGREPSPSLVSQNLFLLSRNWGITLAISGIGLALRLASARRPRRTRPGSQRGSTQTASMGILFDLPGTTMDVGDKERGKGTRMPKAGVCYPLHLLRPRRAHCRYPHPRVA